MASASRSASLAWARSRRTQRGGAEEIERRRDALAVVRVALESERLAVMTEGARRVADLAWMAPSRLRASEMPSVAERRNSR